MKRKKLYIVYPVTCRSTDFLQGREKAMSVLIFIYPTAWKDHRIRSASVLRTGGIFIRMLH